ncbi:MAG: hypothetical protein ACK5GD_00330 [Planctomycetota bacterium]
MNAKFFSSPRTRYRPHDGGLAGLHALAIPLPSSLANACGPCDSSRGRILLKPSVGIVPSPLSSNIIDNETTITLQAESVGTFTKVPPA